MRAFAQLLDSLGTTQSRNRKIALLAAYVHSIPDPDRGWAMAALTDGVPIRLPLRRMLTALTARVIDPVLYKMSRDYVGDTAETVALLWPDDRSAAGESPSSLRGGVRGGGIDLDQFVSASSPHPALRATHPVKGRVISDQSAGHSNAPTLNTVITIMSTGTTTERTESLGALLDALDSSGRWALLKLLGGAPRVGVSARLAKTALAEAFARDLAEIEELWHALEPPYLDLFAWLVGSAEKPDPGSKPVFRPVMLAHPIGDEDWPKLRPQDFAAEWKWDGIRVQVSARGGEVRIFSRQGDDISAAFPDISSAFLAHDCVADGELLVMRDGAIAPFNDLQQRLNRKTVSAKMQRDFPAHVRLYDVLFEGAEDLRALPFTQRRARLESWHANHTPPLTDLSSLIPFETFDDLTALWSSARSEGIEGLMLKRRMSAYQAGRVKGEWFKWKRAALTLDCVLMYAQRGSGKRSSFYSDTTFGVWRTNDTGARDLVPVGKAYSGFTDAELKQLDRWIRDHTTETFGPVRAVEVGLVFEVAFDAVQSSTRHKSGVAMRFPRIHRIRWDKPATDADTLETVTSLLGHG